MTADASTRPPPRLDPLSRVRGRLRSVARRGLWVLARPYARRRVRRADALARLGRLEAETAQVGERHSEQIERLEDFARELVLTAESLRREIAELAAAVEQPREEAPQRGRVKR